VVRSGVLFIAAREPVAERVYVEGERIGAVDGHIV
jgi:hypothetical protein